MIINGQYTSAKTMCDDIEESAIEQIADVCNMKKFQDSQICIMPDVHSGKGCVIGFTAKVKDFAIPNLVGVDISCSISTTYLSDKNIDFDKLDKVIRENVPSGMSCRQKKSKLIPAELEARIREVCAEIGETNVERHLLNLGTIGGGNHFIEIDVDPLGGKWLTLHFGSRNLGKKICEYHQNIAVQRYNERNKIDINEQLQSIVPEQRQQWLEAYKNNMQNEFVKPDLMYIEGADLDLYIKHMKVAQEYAELNHYIVLSEIRNNMGWDFRGGTIFTNHNYIEFRDDCMIIRKGAIAADKGKQVVIPLNMADGILICNGKGNEEWNCSAPHGAGRVLSRGKAKERLTVEEFQDKMQGIYSTCISENTLDESPMAYKDKDIIINSIGETVDIVGHLKPIYNYKAN